jgi:hypothetical protein
MSKTTENSIGSLSINDYKLRTNLAKDRMRLREYIFRNNPGTLTPIGQGEKIVVPSPRTFGIDGTLSEINDVSGEYKYKVIACASTTGVILRGRHQYDFAKSDTIWSTNLEKDLLQMRLLEFQAINETCKNAQNDDLIIVDGPFWAILKDIKNLVEIFPELCDRFDASEFKTLVDNLMTNTVCYIVKDFFSYDLKIILDEFRKDYNQLIPKRVFSVVLHSNESFIEKIHQNQMLTRLSSLRVFDSNAADYIDQYERLLNFSKNIYKGEILKFDTNDSPLKVEYLNNKLFQKSKQSIFKALSIEMLGIQKEPYATFFAEDFAKSEMKRRFSLNSLDEKIAMEQEDFLHNLPFRVRT